MYISYNKYQVYGKVVMLTIFYSLIVLFVFLHPPLPVFHLTFQAIFLIALWLLIFCFCVFMTLQLLFFPKAIEINNIDNTLTVHYFLLRPNIIYSTDISEYTTTKLVTKSTDYEGVLVHIKSGRKYLFNDISLSDYKPVKSFLDDCKISFAGHEKFSNISYFISFFKYK